MASRIMLYEVGDRVQVHDKKWYDSRVNIIGCVDFVNDPISFNTSMIKYLGQIATIELVLEEERSYRLKFDSEGTINHNIWKSWMFKKIDDREISLANKTAEYSLQEQKRDRLDWINEEIDKLLRKPEIDNDTLQHLLYLCDEKELVVKEIRRMHDFISQWKIIHKKQKK